MFHLTIGNNKSPSPWGQKQLPSPPPRPDKVSWLIEVKCNNAGECILENNFDAMCVIKQGFALK